jgi:light-regulated signal transduction histidine kinase (bacteriophytochrome)
MESGAPVDLECSDGLRIYSVPIRAGEEIVGAINFGYGDPPRDDAKLEALSARFHVSVEELRRHAAAYESRPPFIIEVAKRRLRTSAQLIGATIAAQLGTRLEAERAMAERTAQLEESNKELEAFSFSISHDLRAPLRAINGFTSMLVEDCETLDAEGRRLAAVIRENATKMGRLIDDLLAFSRLGRAKLSHSLLDMGAMARGQFFELTTDATRARIDFELSAMPAAVGDPALMKQVWANLLSNAIKFSSKHPRARIEVSGEDRPDELVYQVRDDGAGFDMRYVEKLFGVFQRLHSSRDFDGTGVGLALVQRIIRRHGGRVWATGVPSRGATFSFALPKKGASEHGRDESHGRPPG